MSARKIQGHILYLCLNKKNLCSLNQLPNPMFDYVLVIKPVARTLKVPIVKGYCH